MTAIYELYEALLTIKITVRQKTIHARIAHSLILMIAVFL